MAEYIIKMEDVDPLMEGLAILGTGGGGNPEWGRAIMKKDLEAGKEYKIVDPEDVADDALITSGGIMGSVKTLESMSMEELLKGWDERFEIVEALKCLERLYNRKVSHIVPFEVGGLNTPVMFAVAARTGITVINGDALGRCAPETQMTSFIGHGISLTPMPLADHKGNTIIVTESANSIFPDQIGRWMVTNGGGLGGNVHYPMSGAELKRAVVPKTITKAMEIGKIVIKAREKGQDPVKAFIEYSNGIHFLKGQVVKVSGEDRGGFYLTVVELQGQGLFEGHQAKLVIKNETMALWVDGELKVLFPDMVCMLTEDGRGIMSVEIKEGMVMNLVGMPCHPRLRASATSDIGQEAFSPARYGFPELVYQPLEELNKK
ncbi:DUF917 domain-containing protein [Zhaonella formicivorans]|uniref:DUF917 domain-containing protein n=1 Tax=Zhaonella formicivorans TaxID=2528593 RepID=UPI0010EBEFB2|nr:DUF917 domain-containing protein [Zhaonella formicivorans]